MARCLLISFSGYPTTPSSLMPDNGLAALAASLLEAGHQVLVRDLNTIHTMSRLYPPKIGEAVRPLARAIFCEGGTLPWRDKVRMLRLAGRLERHQEGAIDAGRRRKPNRNVIRWREPEMKREEGFTLIELRFGWGYELG